MDFELSSPIFKLILNGNWASSILWASLPTLILVKSILKNNLMVETWERNDHDIISSCDNFIRWGSGKGGQKW